MNGSGIYIKEIKQIIEENPRNYISIIKSKSKKYLFNYIYNITKILDNNYTLKTRVYWVINNIKSFDDPKVRCKNPVCPVKNGAPLLNFNVRNINFPYKQTCSKKCERQLASQTNKANLKDKYNIENVFQLNSVKEKISDNKDKIYEKSYLTKKQKYGDGYFNNSNKANKTKIDKYGSVWNLEKIYETKELLYSNKNWNNPLKNTLTKKQNNSFNISADELLVYDMLKFKYKTLKTNHSTKKYPFNCDFYDEETETYIEYQGSWTHGTHQYNENNEEDLKQIEIWKNKNTKYYDNAINTWTIRDVNKRNTAKQNNLKYYEFWTINEVYEHIKEYIDNNDLYIIPNIKKLNNHKKYFDNKEIDVNKIPIFNNKNYIIKYFQQDIFYKKEKELYQDPNIKQKLIENRCKYLNKTEDELTIINILDGFKRSGIYYGYSFFNPLLFKWFIKKYNIKSVYDFCGGWGNRLLGAKNLDLYIYNDFSKTTKNNVDRMIKFFNIKNTITFNKDARTFIPEEKFEAMFSCPPYFNVEKYECDEFVDLNDYKNFIDKQFEIFEVRKDCRIFGLVTREDLIFNHTNYIESYIVSNNISKYLTNKKNSYIEKLYIYEK